MNSDDSDFEETKTPNQNFQAISTEFKFPEINESTKGNIKFSLLSKFFKTCSEAKGKKKLELASYFLNSVICKNDRKNIFSVLRLILPEQDRERGSYGLKESSLAKLFSESLSLSSVESSRLKNFKNPNLQPQDSPVISSFISKIGDFSLVLASILKRFCREDSQITISELNESLDIICRSNDKKVRSLTLSKIVTKCTAEDMKWISRIILKDLKISLKHEKILGLFHPEALDLFNLTSDLKQVCLELENFSYSVSKELKIFRPVKPMLAGKRTLDQMRTVLEGTRFLIETKFDGERIQAHICDGDIKFFSRNSHDYTHIYGPRLGPSLLSNVKPKKAVLDGEIIVLDLSTGKPMPFGMNKTIALDNDSNQNSFGLCYKIFDILYIESFSGDGINLMQSSLIERKKALQRNVNEIPNLIEIVEGKEGNSFDFVEESFVSSQERGEEGIIIKQINTIYLPNDRSSNWLKLKSDYIEGLDDTLDLLIIGGYFGKGIGGRIGNVDWTDHITHFLLGVAKSVDKMYPMQSNILPFCKVGTGYSFEELENLRRVLKACWSPTDPRRSPAYFGNWIASASDKPDNPSTSVILEVKAAEYIKATCFPTQYTLRFPRVVKIRFDKDWHECLSSKDLEISIENSKNFKPKSKKRKPEELTETFVPKKRIKTRELMVLPHLKPTTEVRNIVMTSSLFRGFEFYIVNVESIDQKKTLETQILQNGGKVVQNFLMTNTHIVASRVDFKVEILIKNHPRNIINPIWISDCLEKSELQDLAPKYLLFSTEFQKNLNGQLYDQFGDSFCEKVSKIEILTLCKKIKVSNSTTLNKDHQNCKNELRLKLGIPPKNLENVKIFVKSIKDDYFVQLLSLKV